MYLVKAGESHGKAMVGILCNVPAGIVADENFINSLLKDRSYALGRSERQTFENDRIDLITGIRNGITLGGNMAFAIKNNANSQFSEVMGEFSADINSKKLTALRPGHAELGGLMRTGFSDGRNILEGASARSTCIDVASGGISLSMLKMLGIEVVAFVRSIGRKKDNNNYNFEDIKDVKSPAFSCNGEFVRDAKEELSLAEKEGESLGGSVEIMVKGMKGGFGNYVGEKRIDGAIALHLMEIQSVKGVYFGKNPFNFDGMGTSYSGHIEREKNTFKMVDSSTGGISGGMTEGGIISATVGIKPIPTTRAGVKTCDYLSGEECISAKERCDTTSVFALCPILRCVTATVLTEFITERLGADNMTNIIKRYNEL